MDYLGKYRVRRKEIAKKCGQGRMGEVNEKSRMVRQYDHFPSSME
jgi:hypothetical protein